MNPAIVEYVFVTWNLIAIAYGAISCWLHTIEGNCNG